MGISVLLAAALVWAGVQQRQNLAYQRQIQGMYTRSFYELVGNMQNMEVTLSKLLVANSVGNNVELMAAITQQANCVADSLSSLPLSHAALHDTMRFVNQVGDLARVLSRQVGEAVPLSTEDREQFQTLHNLCVELERRLQQIQAEGGLQIDLRELHNTYYAADNQDIWASDISESETNGVEYPTLIYDGPFSDSFQDRQPKGLGENEVDKLQACQAAASFFGWHDATGCIADGTFEGVVPGYQVNVTAPDGEPLHIMVSRHGGKVIWMMADQAIMVEQPTLSLEECLARAKEQLAVAGFSSLAPTWTQEYSGLLVVNYAYEEDGRVFYPDLVKVKIRMDTGMMVAFDATGYYMNHVMRPLEEPTVTKEQARHMISPQVSVTREQLAVIPTDGGGEKLCWEFMGSFGDELFIVYIDAQTGAEVKIFKVIDTGTGLEAI